MWLITHCYSAMFVWKNVLAPLYLKSIRSRHVNFNNHLVQHAPPKLGDWARFPVWSYRKLEKRHLQPVQPRAQRWWMGGYKRIVHVRCYHWLSTSAAFIAEAAAWPTAQASGNGRRRSLAVVTLRKEYRNCNWVQTKLTWKKRQNVLEKISSDLATLNYSHKLKLMVCEEISGFKKINFNKTISMENFRFS